jgi:hypothetical protein
MFNPLHSRINKNPFHRQALRTAANGSGQGAKNDKKNGIKAF